MQCRTNRLAAAAATLCAAAACVAPPSLSGPSSAGRLEIRGTTLMMGGHGKLTAWRYDDGQAREVAARWATEGDVISIGSSGEVIARRLGKATVRAQYQDLTGTEMVHVVTSVAGTWRGSVILVDCWQTILTVPDACGDRRGSTAPLVLTVSQSAAAELGNITGTIAVFIPPATGRFVGLLDSSGTFFVQGHVERPEDGLQGAVSLRWQFDGDQLVPMTINEQIDNDVLLTVSGYSASGHLSFTEIWKISALTR